jgi:predicted MPP superfamily phosphohydrolase
MFIILLFTLLLVDLVTYRSVLLISKHNEWSLNKQIFRNVFWILPTILAVCFGVLFFIKNNQPRPALYYFYMLMATFFLTFYLPKIVYLVVHLIDFMAFKIKVLITGVDRYPFVISKVTGIISLLLMALLLYGHIWGRFAYKTVEETLKFDNLPASFNNYKIVHISDFHIGSFYFHKRQIKRMVERINASEPDIILFTGDLVNNFAEEVYNHIPELLKLEARHGKYAVMGNHDYSEYFPWSSEAAMQEGIRNIENVYGKAGFNLLSNTSEPIQIGNDSIYLLGVDNWGLPPFPQHGDLQMALNEVPPASFKILISHDPTHWDEEVIPQSNIDLTLSGHTHGMQMGVKTNKFQWSPVGLKYPKWGGLYFSNKQVMHVNVGAGNIGYLGRIGIWPEITVIRLKN